MQISQHYLPYSKKTVLVITNNELAKLFSLFDREILEITVLEMPEDEIEIKPSGTPNAGPIDFDALKRHKRLELYKKINKNLQKYLKKDFEQIVLCAPEANKNELAEAMHSDVTANVVEVVPKNLASLPLDAVIRILQETRLV